MGGSWWRGRHGGLYDRKECWAVGSCNGEEWGIRGDFGGLLVGGEVRGHGELLIMRSTVHGDLLVRRGMQGALGGKEQGGNGGILMLGSRGCSMVQAQRGRSQHCSPARRGWGPGGQHDPAGRVPAPQREQL